MNSWKLIPIAAIVTLALLQPDFGQANEYRDGVNGNPRTAPVNQYGLPVGSDSKSGKKYSQSELQGVSGAWPLSDAVSQSSTSGLDNIIAPLERPYFTYPILGSGAGRNIWAGSTPSGNREMYVGSSTTTFGPNTYWVSLSYQAGSLKYEPLFSSQYFPGGIVELLVGDVAGDLRPEIVVATGNGEIHLYDQETKRWLNSFTAFPSLSAIRIANLDGVGKSEIIGCSSTKTAVYQDGVQQWSALFGGSDLTVGQMDSDPAYEIALSTGKVLDADTHLVQWDKGSAFGARLKSADIDSDGKDEVIAAEAWYYIWAFDVDLKLPKWSVNADLDISSLALTDFDRDGTLEVAVGDGQWGDVWAFDAVTRNLKYKIPNPLSAVSGIACADLDGDGANEIVFGCGSGSTGSDAIIVSNPLTNATEWSSTHLDGPMMGPLLGDVDGDGEDELVTGSYESESGYSSGRILVFDALTLKLRGMSAPIISNYAWEGFGALELRDVDQDGDQEILVAGDFLYDGALEIYDFTTSNTFALKWSNPVRPDGEPFTAVDAFDVDGDGDMEIIAGNGRAHTGSAGTYVRVYDYNTHAAESTSFHLGGSWSSVVDLAIADLDTTPGVEIAALVGGSNVYIFDGITKEAKGSIPGSFTSMQVKDETIFLSTSVGYILRYGYTENGYNEIATAVQPATGAISGFTIHNITPLDMTFGSGGSLARFTNGIVSGKSVNYGSPYGANYANGVTAGLYTLAANRLPAPELLAEDAITTAAHNELRWTSVSGAATYLVQADTSAAFDNPRQSDWITDKYFMFTLLQGEQTYYYRVKAKSTDGHTESEWSRVQSSYQQSAPSAALDWQLF